MLRMNSAIRASDSMWRFGPARKEKAAAFVNDEEVLRNELMPPAASTRTLGMPGKSTPIETT